MIRSMDLEMLQFRARILQSIRSFFIGRGYLETDTPALSPNLIPETCLEIFRTDYVEPWSGKTRPLYLVPSPEIYMKRIIARHKVPVFQLSKCYRNTESIGRIHSPEFTMLEYYTMYADYRSSARLTEELFEALLPPPPAAAAHTAQTAAAAGAVQTHSDPRADEQDPYSDLRPPFIRMTMDDAFLAYAGFNLSEKQTVPLLAAEARKLGLTISADEHWDDIYEMILVHAVEPALPREKPVFLTDYPTQVPCLAKNAEEFSVDGKRNPLWKQRWELYVRGIELANCYTEETDPDIIREYFLYEGKLKNEKARIPHAVDSEYWRIFSGFPPCSGTAMGADRLIMLLAGQKTIETVLPFPLDFFSR